MLVTMLQWLTKALRRHPSKAALASNAQPPGADQLFHQILALEAIGWRVTQLRPSVAGDEPPLWRVAITRFDLDASMTASSIDPADALAELLHYASADAAEER
jgi:hypothetical protein